RPVFGTITGRNNIPADWNNGTAGRIGALLRMGTRDYLLPNQPDEFLHLPLHLFHALAHLQDDCNAGDVNPEIASQIENEFKALQILIGIKPRVVLSA